MPTAYLYLSYVGTRDSTEYIMTGALILSETPLEPISHFQTLILLRKFAGETTLLAKICALKCLDLKGLKTENQTYYMTASTLKYFISISNLN